MTVANDPAPVPVVVDTWRCSAAKHFGQQESCTAPTEQKHRCAVCSHTVCDVCTPAHLCSHDDLRRMRADGFGYFGFCNHANVCPECKGHGLHRPACRRRPADVSRPKMEAKRVVKRDAAIEAVSAALTVLHALHRALGDTHAAEAVLIAIPNAISYYTLKNALDVLHAVDGPPKKFSTQPIISADVCTANEHSLFCRCQNAE